MKKNLFITGLAIVTCCSILFTSCKDDSNDNEPISKSYRVKTLTDITGLAALNFSYDQQNRIQKISYTESGIEHDKTEWSWNGDTANLSHKHLEDGIWESSPNTERFIYSNGKLQTSEQKQNNTIIISFTWNGDLLAQEVFKARYSDTLLWVITKDYIYEGDRLTTINLSNEGGIFEKRIIEYANGKPVSLKTFRQDVLTESIGFTYTGNNITTLNYYDVFNGVQGDIDCLQDRTYDGNNLLATTTEKCDGNIDDYFKYTYEEAKGNFDEYLIAHGNWVFVYLFPNSFPPEDFEIKK